MLSTVEGFDWFFFFFGNCTRTKSTGNATLLVPALNLYEVDFRVFGSETLCQQFVEN